MATDLEVEISQTRPGRYQVQVVQAAAGGEPRAPLRLDVDGLLARRSELEATVLASAVTARRAVPAAEEPVRQVGRALFKALFTGPVAGAYRASLGVAQERQERLRVVLRLGAPELALLPWETLFDPETDHYLCRHEPLVRHVPAPYTPGPQPVRPPLQILVVIAAPRGLPALDTDAERGRLEKALSVQITDGRVELTWLEQATWDRVHGRLLDGQWHVLHFIGHGDFDPATDEGQIALVGDTGGAHLVEASRLADLLQEARPTPRLVVLNSCASAQGGTQDVFSSTGATLVRSGINAVAAMQFTVSDRAAERFAHGFYTALAHGRRIDEAAQSGRIAVLGAGRTLEWITPVLYVRGETTQLFTIAAPSTPTEPAGSETRPQFAPAPDARQRDAHLHALYVMASAELRVGHHDNALTLLDDLLGQDPDYRDASALREVAAHQQHLASSYQHAQAAEESRDWAAAIRAYTDILDTDPDFRDAAARRDTCHTRQHIDDLQAQLRYHADASQWQAALDVSAELHDLDPTAADPDQLATHARDALEQQARAAEKQAHIADLERRNAATRRGTGKRRQRASAGDQHPAAPEVGTGKRRQRASAADQQPTVPKAGSARRPGPPRLLLRIHTHSATEPLWHPTGLAWHPTEPQIAVGDTKWAHVYDTTTGAELLRVRAAHLRGDVRAVAFSPDATRLVTCSGHRVRLWDTSTGKRRFEIRHEGKHAEVVTVAFSPDGTRLATGGYVTARIWDAATGHQQLEIRPGGTVHAVAFSPDGTRLATGSHPEGAKIWDAASGTQQLQIPHDQPLPEPSWGTRPPVGLPKSYVSDPAGVRAVAFSPDGTRLATVGSAFTTTAKIWDAATGHQQLVIPHEWEVCAVAFSPDGTRLATGSGPTWGAAIGRDSTARIWGTATGHQQQEIRPERKVRAVAFSPDGTRLAIRSEGTVDIWQVGDA